MNKPAPQEPSMDEILSSIRQIIADDDAGVASRRAAAGPLLPPTPRRSPMTLRPQVAMPVESTPEPLALSASQIVPPSRRATPTRTPAEPPLSYQSILAKDAGRDEPGAVGEPDLVDPEDVTFEPDPEPAPARRRTSHARAVAASRRPALRGSRRCPTPASAPISPSA